MTMGLARPRLANATMETITEMVFIAGEYKVVRVQSVNGGLWLLEMTQDGPNALMLLGCHLFYMYLEALEDQSPRLKYDEYEKWCIKRYVYIQRCLEMTRTMSQGVQGDGGT